MQHLFGWFSDLAQHITYTVIAGMGGGGIIYQPIPPTELEAWARISGTAPTRLELQLLRQMVMAFVAGKNSKEKEGEKHQNIGDYCQDAKLDQCRAMFGDTLANVCATCPN